MNAEFLAFTTGGELKTKNHHKLIMPRKAKVEAFRSGKPLLGIECPPCSLAFSFVKGPILMGT
jgi:hypothetical protein